MADDTREWREVPGTNGNYLVSDDGQVWSRPRKGTVGGLLTLNQDIYGYFRASIRVSGKQRGGLVHRLVLEAFVGSGNGLECRHLDGDPTNNRLDNLRWGTHAENMRDMVRHGSHPNRMMTHCIRGHPFDESNMYVAVDGYRRCRACDRRKTREYRRRKAAA